MSNRKPIPDNVQTDVLTKSRRRCCICFGLEHDLTVKQGQIAHLDQNPDNHDPDNLAFLCLQHHDRYDGKTSQSKNLTIAEVKTYRRDLWTAIEHNHHEQPAAPAATNPKQREILKWRNKLVSLHRCNGPAVSGYAGRSPNGWISPQNRDYLIIDCNENYVRYQDMTSGQNQSAPLEDISIQMDETKSRLLLILKT